MLAVMEDLEMRLLACTSMAQPLNFVYSIEPKNWKILWTIRFLNPDLTNSLPHKEPT